MQRDKLKTGLTKFQNGPTKMISNFLKSKLGMHLDNKHSLHPDSQLKGNDTVIPIVQQNKYLGLIFDK